MSSSRASRVVCPVCVCVGTRVFEQGVRRGCPVCVCVGTCVLEQGVTRGLPRVCVWARVSSSRASHVVCPVCVCV